MKIKQVSKKTKLTERTIRFYVEKRLIDPVKSEQGGRIYLDFTNEDIVRLQHIAILRRMAFGLDDISDMLSNPENINAIVHNHLKQLKQSNYEMDKILADLTVTAEQSFQSLDELAEQLSEAAVNRQLPQTDIQPNFSRFDSETDEEKNDAYLDFLVSMRMREKREKIMRPIKKSVLLILVLMLIVALVVLISGIPQKIDVTYPAVQMRYSGEDSVPLDIVETNISINGKFSNRLFSSPAFSGKIIIDNLPHLHTYELIDLVFTEQDSVFSTIVTYTTVENGRPVLDTVGQMYVDKKFQHVMIRTFEPVSDSHKAIKDLQLLAPANTEEAAVSIYKQLTPQELQVIHE